MNNILHGLNLPPVVQNRTIPLDQKLRAEQEAEVSNNVHFLKSRQCGHSAAVALIHSTAQANNLRDHFSAMFWAVIAPVNNLAVMETKTAYDLLKKQPKIFRQAVKRNAKITMERIDSYDAAVVNTMKRNLNGDRSQYWLDYSDEHYSSLQHDLEIFYLTVLQVLTKHEEQYREIKARLVTSHALLRYAIGMYDTYFRKVEENWHVSLEHLYRDARLSYVQSPWTEVVDALCTSRKPIDIDGDPNVRLAFQVIERHVISLDRINDIGQTAMSYNPDIESEVYHNPMNTDEGFNKSFVSCFSNK